MPERESGNFSAPKPSEPSSTPDWESWIVSIWDELRANSPRFRFITDTKVVIKFYPYRNGNNSVFYEKGILFAKLHSRLKTASPKTVEAMFRLLISKLLRLEVMPEWKEEVSLFIDSLDDSRPLINPNLISQGRHYDLAELKNRVIGRYFPKIDSKILSVFWSNRVGTRRLGSYEKRSMTIRISPVLDDPNVPQYVLEHVIHHEILHHILPVRRVLGRNRIHSREFKEREREFSEYRAAISWLRRDYPNFLRYRKRLGK